MNTANLLHDPMLPHLERVTDTNAMAEAFAQKLRVAYGDLNYKIENLALERVQHRRGRRCRLLYRLYFRAHEGKLEEQWFYAKLVRPGQAQRQYEEALYASELRNGIWKPVALWPEMNLIVWAFPNDPDVPGLLAATDLELVKKQIDAHLAQWGLATPWHCATVRCARVKYMPGKRCVLRYHAELAHPSGATKSVSFYSKTYSDGMSRFHFQNVAAAHEHMPKLNIPRPILHWEEANTYWQEPWEGTPLLDTLPALNWERVFPQLGRVLADFHQSQCPALPRADMLDRAFDSAEEDAQRLAVILPQHEAALLEALQTLQSRRGRLARPGAPLAPIHGAIRVEQIVARGEEYALVDFDAASLGDPHYDVAEFVASLEYLQFTRGWERTRLARAAEIFQSAYARLVSWPLEQERIAWYAVVSVLGKLHDALKNLDRPALAQIEATVACLDAWTRQCRS